MRKCAYCDKVIDNNDSTVVIKANKYYHRQCLSQYTTDKMMQQAAAKKIEAEAQLKAKEALEKSQYTEQELKDKEELENFIKQLFHMQNLTPKIINQIDNFYLKDYGFSGMRKTLEYFYVIHDNDISAANSGIGIIPYVYDEAKRYYYEIWLAQQQNIRKNIQDYKPKIKEITIKTPQRKIPNLFPILDKEDFE